MAIIIQSGSHPSNAEKESETDREAYLSGDVAVFNCEFEKDGISFPAGTECVVLSGLEDGDYEVQVLEPRREAFAVPAHILDAVQP